MSRIEGIVLVGHRVLLGHVAEHPQEDLTIGHTGNVASLLGHGESRICQTGHEQHCEELAATLGVQATAQASHEASDERCVLVTLHDPPHNAQHQLVYTVHQCQEQGKPQVVFVGLPRDEVLPELARPTYVADVVQDELDGQAIDKGLGAAVHDILVAAVLVLAHVGPGQHPFGNQAYLLEDGLDVLVELRVLLLVAVCLCWVEDDLILDAPALDMVEDLDHLLAILLQLLGVKRDRDHARRDCWWDDQPSVFFLLVLDGLHARLSFYLALSPIFLLILLALFDSGLLGHLLLFRHCLLVHSLKIITKTNK